jgi:alkylation response protein AidB-like acyl-CoA dehydrogenase
MNAPIGPSLGPQQLRSAVREWAAANTPPAWHDQLKTATRQQFREFNIRQARLLREAGLLATHWPQEFGGGGFTFAQQLVIQEELVRADFPQPRLLEIALAHIAATLIAYGSAGQRRHLHAILDGEIWCQGFSEPDAGSDLASLRTRAVRTGDGYVVNGQKVWSSYADQATWCLLLARTDPAAPRHRGLSLFMLELDSPGVEIRPIRQATGTEEFSELFLTDVRVPAEHLIGEENAGWRMAQTTLATERAFNILELQARLAVALGEIAAQALTTPVAPGRMAADDDSIRQELAARAAEVDVLGLLGQRLARDVERSGEVGPEGSIVKLFYSETLQKLTALAVRITGLPAMLDERREFATSWTSGHWMIDHLKSWNWTIAAGSNEIQRNIIGEKVLGLPREPVSWGAQSGEARSWKARSWKARS